MLTPSADIIAAVTYARWYYYSEIRLNGQSPFHITPNLALARQASLSTWLDVASSAAEERRCDLSFLDYVFEKRDSP